MNIWAILAGGGESEDSKGVAREASEVKTDADRFDKSKLEDGSLKNSKSRAGCVIDGKPIFSSKLGSMARGFFSSQERS